MLTKRSLSWRQTRAEDLTSIVTLCSLLNVWQDRGWVVATHFKTDVPTLVENTDALWCDVPVTWPLPACTYVKWLLSHRNNGKGKPFIPGTTIHELLGIPWGSDLKEGQIILNYSASVSEKPGDPKFPSLCCRNYTQFYDGGTSLSKIFPF